MTITLPLRSQEEARLIAQAEAKGVSTDSLVREALDKILADAPAPPDEPKREWRPIWDVMLDNMKDVPRRNSRGCRKTERASTITISTGIPSAINERVLCRQLLLVLAPA
jgi:hypothetical protein